MIFWRFSKISCKTLQAISSLLSSSSMLFIVFLAEFANLSISNLESTLEIDFLSIYLKNFRNKQFSSLLPNVEGRRKKEKKSH